MDDPPSLLCRKDVLATDSACKSEHPHVSARMRWETCCYCQGLLSFWRVRDQKQHQRRASQRKVRSGVDRARLGWAEKGRIGGWKATEAARASRPRHALSRHTQPLSGLALPYQAIPTPHAALPCPTQPSSAHARPRLALPRRLACPLASCLTASASLVRRRLVDEPAASPSSVDRPGIL